MKKTITSIFLIPVLGLDKGLLKQYDYVNSFSDMEDKELDYDPHVVYIVFKPNSKLLFEEFLETLYNKNEFIVEDFNLDDNYVVVVFGLDKRFNTDYELIKQSKYSETSKEFQELFPKTITNVVKGKQIKRKSLQNLVFNKDNSLLEYWENKTGVLFTNDMEVWYEYDEKLEILDIEKIIKNEEND
jgi:hypothetical protein